MLYPPELRRQCAGQSIQRRRSDTTRRHAARAKTLPPAAIIGYGVTLDTRTTSAGKQPLTATRRVHNVEGWRCYEHGHEPDFAVLAGWRPSAAAGGATPEIPIGPALCCCAARRSRVGWVAGWLSTEFPPHVVTGHALSRVSHPSIGRVGTTWAAQRADQALTAALEESFGPDFREQVCHPTCASTRVCPPRRLLRRPGPHRRYAAQTSDISYGPGGRDNLLDIWRRHDLAPGRRAPVLIQVPGGAWAVNGKRVSGVHADEPDGRTRLDLRLDQLQQEPAQRLSRAPHRRQAGDRLGAREHRRLRRRSRLHRHHRRVGGRPPGLPGRADPERPERSSPVSKTPTRPFRPPRRITACTTSPTSSNMHDLMLPFLEQFVMRARYADDPERFEAASPHFLRAPGRAAVLRAARRERRIGSQRPGPGVLRGAARRRRPDGGLRRTRQRAPRFRHHSRRSDRGWPPTPSPISWASSTAGAPARCWTRRRWRRRRPAEPASPGNRRPAGHDRLLSPARQPD